MSDYPRDSGRVGTWRGRAIDFIAAYDTPDAGKYERNVVRVAHRWLCFMRSPKQTQGVLNDILMEFEKPGTEDDGCAWQDLEKDIIAWSVSEDWLDGP